MKEFETRSGKEEIQMYQEKEEKRQDILSMEEYLKKRQELRSGQSEIWSGWLEASASALKLADVLYI